MENNIKKLFISLNKGIYFGNEALYKHKFQPKHNLNCKLKDWQYLYTVHKIKNNLQHACSSQQLTSTSVWWHSPSQGTGTQTASATTPPTFPLAFSYSLTVLCWQGTVGWGWRWSYCSVSLGTRNCVQGPWVGEGEEHSEWGQWCKGDCELWVKWGGNSNRCCCSNCVADVGEMGG